MKPRIGLFTAFLVLGLSVTVMTHTALSASGDAGKGEKIYQQFCLACHGPEGKGDGPVAATIKPPPANLASKAVKDKPDADLLTVIRKGKAGTAMPPWEKQLSEEQMNDVLSYVRSLNK